MAHQWQEQLRAANSVPRCGAKARTTGHPCKSPAMVNGRCRMHGGKSPGAPKGEKHGRYTKGLYTQEKIASHKETAAIIRQFKRMIKTTL